MENLLGLSMACQTASPSPKKELIIIIYSPCALGVEFADMASDEGKLPETGGTEDQSLIADPSGRRTRPLRLRILLDTNQLFTGSASDLLQEALRKLIEESRSHRDISIEWLVPDVVRFEREYQMTVAATGFVPTLKNLSASLVTT